ncbi:ABC transporter ATP-binding protein [Streptomyces sp. NPDC006134]|uniref:ABC transporter ATP-binding protein n=1 Tax=Streptomyces sp. NPDC006134 TaxID=3154467 RepID=UPI0033E6414E
MADVDEAAAGGPPAPLVLDRVVHHYGDTPALRGVSIALAPGRITGLLGPNGAGKSTLMAIAAGILRPDGGRRHLASGRRVGYMPQEHALYPQLTAAENLGFAAAAVGLRRSARAAAVREALERVGLADRAGDRAGGFSGGMKRRLGFAAATLGGPDVLLLDEPTVGVDPQSRAALLDLTVQECARGTAVLYSTHLMAEVQEHAHHVVVVDHGTVIETGTVERLLGKYALTCLELRLETPGSEALAERLRSHPCFGPLVPADDDARFLRIQVHDSSRALTAAVAAASDMGATLTDVRLVEPSLEAVFLHLTGRKLNDS